MRIEGQWPVWKQAYGAQNPAVTRKGGERDGTGGEPAPADGGSDVVTISDAARQLAGEGAGRPATAGAGGVAAGGPAASGEAPDRAARIALLRAQVEAGTYRVDPERLADRLIERWTAWWSSGREDTGGGEG
ncbi:MAG: flagellar biosynthesis anti-sigma factor FlgM [Alicyclobacillaceae bacterium]|nr:flagellar biosynthesis anti-sigma factor FlgM [Alicyclobacillaceae bacterium]